MWNGDILFNTDCGRFFLYSMRFDTMWKCMYECVACVNVSVLNASHQSKSKRKFHEIPSTKYVLHGTDMKCNENSVMLILANRYNYSSNFTFTFAQRIYSNESFA